MFFFKSNYQRSKDIEKVKFPISPYARELFLALSQAKQHKQRQQFSVDLVDELCDLARIDIVNVKISEKKQYHKKSGGRVVYKQYGYYRVASKYIYINNRTAVRGQVLAAKTFLDTLLHEWMHHYDHKKLGLNSIHTSGFYARLRDLKEKLGYFEL
ncbi:hypothetical protein H6758_02075 [Candidatus Nomurabacteria bacterium]|nr:hypothetical protein [Candidatus Nomurabacteria bacterium]